MRKTSSKTQLALSSLNHFTVDGYSAMLTPLWPAIMTLFSLSQGTTAFIAASLGVIVAFIQPIGATIGIKFGEKRMQILSVLLSAIFIPLIGVVNNLVMLIVFLTLGRIGNGFFHPNAAAFVGKMGFYHEHTAMSLFSIGGSLGGAIMPVVIVWYVKLFGFRSMYLLSFFGVIIAVLSLLYLPRFKESADHVKQMPGFGLKDSLSVRGVKGLVFVIVLRSLTLMMFSNLLPLYLKQIGQPLVWGGYFLTFSTLAGTLGNYLGAILSDKIGPKNVNVLSIFAAFPFALALVLIRNTYIMLVMYIIMAFFAFFTMASNVSYMQKFLPHRKGIASSLGMGISWGMASSIFVGISLMINSIGLHTVLFIGVFSLAAAAITALRLPKAEKSAVNLSE